MEMLPVWKRNSVTDKITFHVFVIVLSLNFLYRSVGFQPFLYLREKRALLSKKEKNPRKKKDPSHIKIVPCFLVYSALFLSTVHRTLT